ncbi:hypothetical protein Zmor_007886 [Zophobas morio]|uniref:Odorant receptor n=1 Tax=Zophobas morio TaxID=2755281 RepID=A0AA38IYE9_9CUCU|nr:hypothetical protein Zmor_007886 [Zophobas morio]
MMEKYEWRYHIKFHMLTLRMLGLWPRGEEIYKPGLYMVHSATALTVFLLGHIFFQVVNIYFIRTNLEAVTGTVYVLVIDMLVVFKVYCVITNMGMLKQLLRTLDTDMFQPKNTIQMSAIQISTCIVYITAIHINIDALVAALNVFNGSQFDILCDNLRNLHKLGENILKNFIGCVKHHKEILSFADKSNRFLNWILFVQFFVFAFCIGITLFQLTLVVPMSNEFFSLLSYGVAITMQIFMYCWFGNEIEVKSSNIPYAAFECQWTDFSEKIKKKLLFFTLVSQKPVRFSAINLFYLNLDTFLRILKTSYSYFALLHQVNS